MLKLFHDWRRDTRAATAIEYSLIAAGIALALVIVIPLVGDDIGTLFDQLRGWFPG